MLFSVVDYPVCSMLEYGTEGTPNYNACVVVGTVEVISTVIDGTKIPEDLRKREYLDDWLLRRLMREGPLLPLVPPFEQDTDADIMDYFTSLVVARNMRLELTKPGSALWNPTIQDKINIIVKSGDEKAKKRFLEDAALRGLNISDAAFASPAEEEELYTLAIADAILLASLEKLAEQELLERRMVWVSGPQITYALEDLEAARQANSEAQAKVLQLKEALEAAVARRQEEHEASHPQFRHFAEVARKVEERRVAVNAEYEAFAAAEAAAKAAAARAADEARWAKDMARAVAEEVAAAAAAAAAAAVRVCVSCHNENPGFFFEGRSGAIICDQCIQRDNEAAKAWREGREKDEERC